MSKWGHVEERFATPAPRKMLTLDGGGIRGVMRRVGQAVAQVSPAHLGPFAP